MDRPPSYRRGRIDPGLQIAAAGAPARSEKVSPQSWLFRPVRRRIAQSRPFPSSNRCRRHASRKSAMTPPSKPNPWSCRATTRKCKADCQQRKPDKANMGTQSRLVALLAAIFVFHQCHDHARMVAFPGRSGRRAGSSPLVAHHGLFLAAGKRKPPESSSRSRCSNSQSLLAAVAGRAGLLRVRRAAWRRRISSHS